MFQFHSIDYLQDGTSAQVVAYNVLVHNHIMDILAPFSPVLAGTIPLNINIEGSDLDILCCFDDPDEFIATVEPAFSHHEKFALRKKEIAGIATIIANFYADGFEIEVFGQPVPVARQNGYRHMIIEHQILKEKGEAFRLEVIRLKESGMKTEPAFARLLGLVGDPYEALLRYKT